MRNIIFFIALLPIVGLAQTGPGGVGANDGTSSLELWLDANTEVYSDLGVTLAIDEGLIRQWNDQSGNDHHALQNTSSAQPSYETGTGSNGYPTITFQSSGTSANVDYLDLTTHVSNIIDKIQSFFIVSTNSASNEDIVLYVCNTNGNINANFDYNGNGDPDSQLEFQFGFGNANDNLKLFIQDGTDANLTDIATVSSTASRIGYAEWNEGTNARASSNNNVGVSDAGPPGSTELPSTFFIGRHASSTDNLDRSHDGDLSEVIIYNNIIDSAQRIIVHNYLAAKYGLSLTANDLYDEDNIGAGNYDHDVAGIGRINASNLHDDAQGTGIVRILNPTDLNNDEFLIWGHDNGAQQATETTDVPGVVQARFDRVWRASEVNTSSSAVDVGNIDLRFDLTGLGSVTASDLRLLVDTDNDGVFNDETPISGATSIGGNIYEFSGVSAIANNMRFTLGTINSSRTPLPIELVYFNAIPENMRTVKLEWQTASEINNDFFKVERSLNGFNWEIVKTIEGAGDSRTLLSYSTVDNSPYNGVSYYRLKQTDYDGKFEYSDIKSVNLNSMTSDEVSIHPNPTSNVITVHGNTEELAEIKIMNALGQEVTNLISITNENDSTVLIDLSNLSQGTYYVKTKTTANSVYKK